MRVENCERMRVEKLDGIELRCQDCMEYMRGLEDGAFDLAIVDPPFDIIDADSVKDAVREYNKKHNCSYFYGCPMCEITANGECVGIDISTSRQMCEDILKYLIGKK